MTANFLHVKVLSNEMVGIHRKNSSILLRPTKIQDLIQVYASKAISRTARSKDHRWDELRCKEHLSESFDRNNNQTYV